MSEPDDDVIVYYASPSADPAASPRSNTDRAPSTPDPPKAGILIECHACGTNEPFYKELSKKNFGRHCYNVVRKRWSIVKGKHEKEKFLTMFKVIDSTKFRKEIRPLLCEPRLPRDHHALSDGLK